MSPRRSALLGGSFALLALVGGLAWQTQLRRPAPRLTDVGPRVVSNQTTQPLSIYGENLRRGMTLRLAAPFERTVPLTVVDSGHAHARLPADLTLPPETVQVTAVLSVAGQRATSEVGLTVVNDAAFADWTQLVRAGEVLWAASSTTDTLARIDPLKGEVTRFPGGDGPSALAAWTEPDGAPRLAVAHAWLPELWILDARTGAVLRTLAAPAYATGVVVDARRRLAIVAETAQNTVRALSLDDGGEQWRREVLPDPKPLALAGAWVVVGSQGSGELEALWLDDGRAGDSIGPRPGTPIVGGHTEPHARDVMGGKAPRALLWSIQLGKLFVTSIGPNIGPNPQRMEVSMNGGVGVVDVGARRFERHLGFGAGVTEGMAIDEDQGRLYLADTGLGLVRAVDAAALAAGDERARKAELWRLPIPPPSGFPLARDPADYGVNGRAGVELHSGPRALALSAAGTELYALDRFTATVAVIGGVRSAQPRVERQIALEPGVGPRERRLGQVLYFADMGRSGMSCDSCHLEGHDEGILFEKTHPLRIYRSPTVRGTRETPPYFTPASTFSLAETSRMVGDRNRYMNPTLTESEVRQLTLFSATVTTLPNPYRGVDGAPPDSIALPGGGTGRPLEGRRLFDGKADCARCHPPPLFTTDQELSTRGHFIDVGTPRAFPLRTGDQETVFRGVGVPSLLGAWDVFPMLSTGLAGFGEDGGRAVVSDRVPLRAMIERYCAPPHGNAAALGAQEKADLLAYLLTL
ncbi:MAG TPA: MtsA protein [Myxococcaceae bacterium]|nr:MtsA protein [Myxococcaceae bacterium]